MARCFKLTDESNRSRGETEWGAGVSHAAAAQGPLCSGGWLHAYDSPYLALLMNPIHGRFDNVRVWEAVGDGRRADDRGLKCGFEYLTTVAPWRGQVAFGSHIRVRFALLCAIVVHEETGWRGWADGWLSNEHRAYGPANDSRNHIEADFMMSDSYSPGVFLEDRTLPGISSSDSATPSAIDSQADPVTHASRFSAKFAAGAAAAAAAEAAYLHAYHDGPFWPDSPLQVGIDNYTAAYRQGGRRALARAAATECAQYAAAAATAAAIATDLDLMALAERAFREQEEGRP